MESRLLLDVVVAKGAAVLELLASENEALLIGRDTLLVLDLGLNVVDGVGGLDLEGDGLAGKSLDEDLHTTSETEHQVEGGLLLDVVIRKSAAVLELLAGEDEALLIGRNALLVLDLGLDIVDGVGGLNLEGDGLAGEGLHEDLHATTEPQDQVESAFLLDVVVRKGPSVLQLLTSEDEPLLVRGDSLLVLEIEMFRKVPFEEGETNQFFRN